MAELVDRYVEQLKQLLPPGSAYSRDPGTVIEAVLGAIADELTIIHNRAQDAIVESDPRTTDELISDWERVLGLPDCDDLEPTLAGRRSTVAGKLVSVGGQSRQYFIDIAQAAGFIITIDEFRPFRVGSSAVGTGLYNEDWWFTWRVNAPATTTVYFRADAGRAGDPLAEFTEQILECRILALKPAHTVVLFAYGLLEYSIAQDAVADDAVIYVADSSGMTVTAPIIVIMNNGNPHRTTISQISSDDSWAQVGNSLNIAGTNAPALAALNATDVAFIDSGNDELRTYRWDGADWAQVGNSLAIAGVNSPALARLNATDIAFFDSAIGELRTYRWDGADWAQVGNSLAVATSGSVSLTALNATNIAFANESANTLRTFGWDGADWAQVGNSLTIAGVGAPALAALNATDVAFSDSGNDELRTYRWDGADWAQVGNSLAIAGVGVPALAALNETDVAFIDSVNDELRTYRWDGADYANAATALPIVPGVGVTVISALNSSDISFFDASNPELRAYRIARDDEITLTDPLPANASAGNSVYVQEI